MVSETKHADTPVERPEEFYDRKKPPAYGTEEFGDYIWNRPDFSSFPPAPCSELCYHKNLKRFHLTCLTCPDRRFRNKTWRSKNLREYKQIIMIMDSASGRKFHLPETYMTYGIILPTNKRGAVHPLKSIIVKSLMTIAERIAEF